MSESVAANAAERVAAIIGAAEQTAARLRSEAEERLRARIAEADRAADNRVRAAEEEAEEIVAEARARGEALVRDAQAEAARVRSAAEGRARELLRDARTTANDLRTSGLELISNLREMGDALRSNSERLLRDVQTVHGRLVAEADRQSERLGIGGGERSRADAARRADGVTGGDDDLDVPEFIPPR